MRRCSFFCLFTLLTFFSGVAHAADLKDFAGTWVMRLGDRNMFVLTLAAENTTVHGTWDGPAKYTMNNGAFSNMHGGVRRDGVVETRFSGGVLHLTVQNANDAKDEDAYAMALVGNHATLTTDDLPADAVVAPMIFARSVAGAMVATDWEPNRLYTAVDSDVACTEMKAIYTEDQRVRMAPHSDWKSIDWKTMAKTDAGRREKTRKLLAAGALHTAEDYEEAAFVFQHGDTAEDYLLAHTLAMVAVSKGDATAIWIASATLDRYLEKIGQKQIFGTQFSSDAQHGWTQEPYDRDLISDAIRQQLTVPVQALQEKQLEVYRGQK